MQLRDLFSVFNLDDFELPEPHKNWGSNVNLTVPQVRTTVLSSEMAGLSIDQILDKHIDRLKSIQTTPSNNLPVMDDLLNAVLKFATQRTALQEFCIRFNTHAVVYVMATPLYRIANKKLLEQFVSNPTLAINGVAVKEFIDVDLPDDWDDGFIFMIAPVTQDVFYKPFQLSYNTTETFGHKTHSTALTMFPCLDSNPQKPIACAVTCKL